MAILMMKMEMITTMLKPEEDHNDDDGFVLPEGASKSAAKVATAEYCDRFSILTAVDDHDILR